MKVVLTDGTISRSVYASRSNAAGCSSVRKEDAVYVSTNTLTKETDWACVVERDGNNVKRIPIFGNPPDNVGELGVGHLVWCSQKPAEKSAAVIQRHRHERQVYCRLPDGSVVLCCSNYNNRLTIIEASCELLQSHAGNDFRITPADIQDEKPQKQSHRNPGKPCFLPTVKLQFADGRIEEGFLVSNEEGMPSGVLVPGGDWKTFVLRPVWYGLKHCSITVLKEDFYANS